VKKRIIALLLALTSMSALAGFVNETGNSNPFDGSDQVKVFGGQKTSDVVVGIGREVPLAEAVSQIVPRGYTAKFLGVERWQGIKLSWQGGRVWIDVLRDALKPTPEISAEVDSDLRVVTFRPTAEGQRAIVDTTVAAETEWQIRVEDRTLKEAIVRWAKMSGWQLVWEIPFEYPVGAAATIKGSFEQALETVIKSMQGAEVQPQVKFYTGNHVVRIVTKGTE